MRKKGFTLVELLAVIVILGVIIAISVPVVSSIMQKSKERAFLIDAQNFMKAAKDEYVTDDNNDNKYVMKYLNQLDLSNADVSKSAFGANYYSNSFVLVDPNGEAYVLLHDTAGNTVSANKTTDREYNRLPSFKDFKNNTSEYFNKGTFTYNLSYFAAYLGENATEPTFLSCETDANEKITCSALTGDDVTPVNTVGASYNTIKLDAGYVTSNNGGNYITIYDDAKTLKLLELTSKKGMSNFISDSKSIKFFDQTKNGTNTKDYYIYSRGMSIEDMYAIDLAMSGNYIVLDEQSGDTNAQGNSIFVSDTIKNHFANNRISCDDFAFYDFTQLSKAEEYYKENFQPSPKTFSGTFNDKKVLNTVYLQSNGLTWDETAYHIILNDSKFTHYIEGDLYSEYGGYGPRNNETICYGKIYTIDKTKSQTYKSTLQNNWKDAFINK